MEEGEEEEEGGGCKGEERPCKVVEENGSLGLELHKKEKQNGPTPRIFFSEFIFQCFEQKKIALHASAQSSAAVEKCEENAKNLRGVGVGGKGWVGNNNRIESCCVTF